MRKTERGRTKKSGISPGVKRIHTLQLPKRPIGVAFDQTGQSIAISADQYVQVWDEVSGDLICDLPHAEEAVYRLAFHPTGHDLACGCQGKVKLWDVASRKVEELSGSAREAFFGVAFGASGRVLAGGTENGTIYCWDVASRQELRKLGERDGRTYDNSVYDVAFHPTDPILASGCFRDVKLWDVQSGDLIRSINSSDSVASVAFDPAGVLLAGGGFHKTVYLWETRTGKLVRTLEGLPGLVRAVSFHKKNPLFAAECDTSVRVWDTRNWDEIARIPKPSSILFNVAFHPSLPRLAVSTGARWLGIYEFDLSFLLSTERYLQIEKTAHYVNSKIVLVGDTGVGKSGLSLVLSGQPFKPTISTAGRHVLTFLLSEQTGSGNQQQTREALLWDLAGQPGYRIIHQLHLNEVSVALVVFDARSETDPLAGVIHWERALRAAHQRRGSRSLPLVKLLVSARADRGGVPVSKERLDALLKEFHFDGYFATSAQEGWQIEQLKNAIRDAIPWPALPVVTSSAVFSAIKAFVLEVKESGRLLIPASQLFEEFKQNRKPVSEIDDLRGEFNACVGRLENRDLVRRLSFGDYILLQPELLDAYASAMVLAAKNEPDGLGSIPEDIALAGRFHVPKEQRLGDAKEEQVLLHATVEELVQHELALRESAADGRYLVFPSQFNRDYEDAPEPPGKAAAVTFDGPTQSLYSTLAVRLGHSGLFETTRTEMWRNAVIFTARAGGRCGIYLQEFSEGRGRLLLFFEAASNETRFHFEEYAVAHLRQRALEGTVQIVRVFECGGCGNSVPDAYVKIIRERGHNIFACPCGQTVPLADPRERLAQEYPSLVEPMNRAADRQRDFDAFVLSASAETQSRGFTEWAGGERVTLAIVFTDVVGSTAMGEKLKDESMNLLRRQHFVQSRQLIAKHHGRGIKTIGDSFMAAFRSVDEALNYARELQLDPGSPEIQVRAGIHIGAMQVEEGDVFGSAVNFAARVVGAIKGAEIWISDQAKRDVDALGARRHKALQWRSHDGELKGFVGTFRLWSLAWAPK